MYYYHYRESCTSSYIITTHNNCPSCPNISKMRINLYARCDISIFNDKYKLTSLVIIIMRNWYFRMIFANALLVRYSLCVYFKHIQIHTKISGTKGLFHSYYDWINAYEAGGLHSTIMDSRWHMERTPFFICAYSRCLNISEMGFYILLTKRFDENGHLSCQATSHVNIFSCFQNLCKKN